jgi:phosphoserine aminotransferase
MKRKNKKYQETLSWDDMSYGEASHHIGKKMTEKVQKSKKDFKRKSKHKNKDTYDDWYPDNY